MRDQGSYNYGMQDHKYTVPSPCASTVDIASTKQAEDDMYAALGDMFDEDEERLNLTKPSWAAASTVKHPDGEKTEAVGGGGGEGGERQKNNESPVCVHVVFHVLVCLAGEGGRTRCWGVSVCDCSSDFFFFFLFHVTVVSFPSLQYFLLLRHSAATAGFFLVLGR